jgi:hypothetical protein
MGVMSDLNLQFPEPEANDADDVVLALETAGALWKRGDAQEGIRWLRRAAEAAEETGDDLRAVALARAAADFASGDTGRRTKDSQPPEPRQRRLPEAPPLAKRSAPTAVSSKAAAASLDSSQELPAPPPRRHAAATPAPAQKATPAPGSSPTTNRPPAPSQRPPRAPSARGESETPLAQLAAMAKADGTPTPTTRSTRGTALKAVRVAVDRVDDDGDLRVRVLEQDAPLPGGTQSAILVATEPVVDQLTRRR